MHLYVCYMSCTAARLVSTKDEQVWIIPKVSLILEKDNYKWENKNLGYFPLIYFVFSSICRCLVGESVKVKLWHGNESEPHLALSIELAFRLRDFEN